MTIKVSVVSKTFRIHDNPFLDSHYYIIFIDKQEYGPAQMKLVHQVLHLHLKDLAKQHITPLILNNLEPLKKYLSKFKEEPQIFIDHSYPHLKKTFKKAIFVPTWTLLDWTPHVKMIQDWFLPEGLRNHHNFKVFTHANRRTSYQSSNTQTKTPQPKINLKNTFVVIPEEKMCLPLPKNNLDSWILQQLHQTTFIKNTDWFKPNTCPDTSILDEYQHSDGNIRTSKLSPFFSLGVLSPLVAYNFWNGENRMGSGRDQLLFREMFHACGQMPEYWTHSFGQAYPWKKLTKKTWTNYIHGKTGRADVDWAMKQLSREGWLHHLARHLVADYLTRGTLQIHWKHGMNWFKETLLDHDDAVNRGNWMGLSGTAFSTKQRSFFHYNPDHFITKKSQKLKCHLNKNTNKSKKNKSSQ